MCYPFNALPKHVWECLTILSKEWCDDGAVRQYWKLKLSSKHEAELASTTSGPTTSAGLLSSAFLPHLTTSRYHSATTLCPRYLSARLVNLHQLGTFTTSPDARLVNLPRSMPSLYGD